MKKPLLFLGALALLGCTDKPKPPLMNLYGHRGLAVLAFQNSAIDPALSGAVTAELLAGLDVLKPLPVAGPSLTAAIAPEPVLVPSAALCARLAGAAGPGCDLVMTGSVTGYREAVTAGDPKRIKASYRAGTWKWGCAEDAVVSFTAIVRLAEVPSGKQVWIKTISAEGKSSRWADLAWDGVETKPPAEGWDAIRLKAGVGAESATVSTGPRYASNAGLEHARAEAIDQVARAVLNDFTGRGGWVPPTGAAPRGDVPPPAGSGAAQAR